MPLGPCHAPGCVRPARRGRRGLCHACYQHLWLHKDCMDDRSKAIEAAMLPKLACCVPPCRTPIVVRTPRQRSDTDGWVDEGRTIDDGKPIAHEMRQVFRANKARAEARVRSRGEPVDLPGGQNP